MAYKVQHPWNYELTDAEIEQQEIQKQLALDYEQKTPWDHENNQTTDEITADFDKKLTGKEFTVVQPWDMTESTILDNQNKAKLAQTYKYVPFWRPERITPKQRAVLKSYQVHANCPYRREDNYEPDKKISSIRCDPNRSAKTLPPWEFGKLSADPVNKKVEPRPPTSLWNKPPEVKKVYPFVSSGDPILDNLREKLFEHGATGMLSLSRKFRIMDDNNNGLLDYDEFRKGMRECKIGDLSENALKHLFHYFDKDDSGSITLDEFMFGIRGALNSRRKGLVDLAFKVLDKDGSGVIDYNDVKDVYNTTSHPDYISGKKSKEQILTEFLSNFDQSSTKTISTGKSTASDGIITYDEFLQYYSNISASIDNDDYFELMIRNAWHISGGEGWSANTSNRRVLVTHEDGRQTVEEIKNDLGLDGKNKDEIINRLKLQGLSNISVNTNGAVDNKPNGYVSKLRNETINSYSLEKYLENSLLNTTSQSSNKINNNKNSISTNKRISLLDQINVDQTQQNNQILQVNNNTDINSNNITTMKSNNLQKSKKPAALSDLINDKTINNKKTVKSLSDHLHF